MSRRELLELIRNGKNSHVEFKRGEADSRAFAKELVAFSNQEGGRVLLGVEDDGGVYGVARGGKLEERVMAACGDKIRPPIIPAFEVVRDIEPGKDVAVVGLEPGWTVHSAWHNNHSYYYIRVGTASREPDTGELQRLFQRRGSVRFETQPVSGSSIKDLNPSKLSEYFGLVREQEAPELDKRGEWERLLLNTEFLVEGESDGRLVCSIAGLLLFGVSPRRFLPHAAIVIAVFPGVEKDYDAKGRATVESSLVRLGDGRGRIVEPGMVDQAAQAGGWLRKLGAAKRDWLFCTVCSAWSEGTAQHLGGAVNLNLSETLCNSLNERDRNCDGGDVYESYYDGCCKFQRGTGNGEL